MSRRTDGFAPMGGWGTVMDNRRVSDAPRAVDVIAAREMAQRVTAEATAAPLAGAAAMPEMVEAPHFVDPAAEQAAQMSMLGIEAEPAPIA